MIELPFSILRSFRASGWRPGRRVVVAQVVPSDHPAYAILAEFAGLRVGHVGSGGKECATSDVVFQLLWPDDTIRVWDELLATRLIGVAEVHHAHEELFVDDHCRFFGASLIHDAFYFHGARLWNACSWVDGLNQCSDQTRTV
jgi:SUKH-3 immunity protein